MINFEIISKPMAHQLAALDKMIPTKVGALFMDMGTGKSLVSIMLAKHRASKINKVVWCCPVSLKKNTQDQILKHTNCSESDVYVFDEKTTYKNMPESIWYVVGIESVGQSDRCVFALNALVDDQTMLIVDESSYIKGVRSKRTRRLIKIGSVARYRLILNGTPISQGIEDLYSQFTFLSDRILGYRNWRSFREAHLSYSERFKGRIDDRLNTDLISNKIAPYTYQVTKDECLDLPEKTFSDRWVFKTSDQLELSELAKKRFFEEIMECEDEGGVAVYRLFGALRAIASGVTPKGYENFGNIKENKSDELINILNFCRDGHIIVWCNYLQSVNQISKRIADNGFNCFQYHGGLNEAQRHDQLEKWRKSGGVLLATSSSGGYGLTLNEAKTAIYFSNSFKYSERLQSEDRIHRIGQSSNTQYISIWTDCKIEERIQKALNKKSNALEALKDEIREARSSGTDKIKELLKVI